MTYILNKRERTALEALERETRFENGDFIYKGKLPTGIGAKTLDKLVELGLAEKGPSKRYWGRQHPGSRRGCPFGCPQFWGGPRAHNCPFFI